MPESFAAASWRGEGRGARAWRGQRDTRGARESEREEEARRIGSNAPLPPTRRAATPGSARGPPSP